MASRRKLKKHIHSTIGLLYNDCIFYKVFVVKADRKAADKVIANAAHVHEDFLKRVSTVEGKEVKGRVKMYYRKLNEDFKKEVDRLGLQIAALDQ